MSVATLKQPPAIKQDSHKQQIVIIGAGMAGTRFAMSYAKARLAKGEQTKQADFEIILINSEPYAGYNRIMLSPVLAGEKQFDEIFLYPIADYARHHIQLKTACHVTHINTAQQQLVVQSNSADSTGIIETLAYNILVFATGSNPFILPLPNSDAQGVFGFRTKMDVDNMLALAKSAPAHCVVIGGGLLGLEAANALANHGANVTVVHVGDYLLDRQLDKTAAKLLQDHLEKKGIHFALHTNSKAIQVTHDVSDNKQVTGLQVEIDGELQTLPADCVVMTVGVRPNIALAQAAGIASERGILVNSQMRTHTPHVYAIGECVQFDNQLFGLVAPVYEQAAILIHTLDKDYMTAHPTTAPTAPVPEKHFSIKPTATKLKVSGVDLFSAGDISPEPDGEELLYYDPAHAIYQKITLKNDRVKSAVLYGDVNDGAWFFELIQNQQNIAPIKDKLLFGQAFCQELLAG